MHMPEARATLNSIIFQTAVQRVGSALAGTTLRMFCECLRDICGVTLSVTAEQYLAALAEPGRRLVAREHRSEEDRVVHDRRSHLVVRPLAAV